MNKNVNHIKNYHFVQNIQWMRKIYVYNVNQIQCYFNKQVHVKKLIVYHIVLNMKIRHFVNVVKMDILHVLKHIVN